MRLRGRRVKLVLAAGVIAGAIAGCGPSFQALYESDVRFEHCYALDENPSVSMEQKEGCWTDWIHHYTYGQTRDRVAYAFARSRAMSRMGQLPTDEAMMGAAPGEVPAGGGITAPAPTSAFAPPPKTLNQDDAGADAATSSGSGGAGGTGGPGGGNAGGTNAAPGATWMSNLPPPPPPGTTADGGLTPSFGGAMLRPPGADCADACMQDWHMCGAKCGDAGATCHPRCDRSYKGCLRGCAAK